MDIPFNMEAVIGSDLRDHPVDRDEMWSGIRFIEGYLQESDLHEGALHPETLRIRSRLGGYYRIVGELEKSRQIHRALDSQNLDSKLRVVNAIRLATTEQYIGNIPEALRILDGVEILVRGEPDLHNYLDFLFQHRGKVYLEAGDYAEASEEFQKALRLRQEKGDQELLTSTTLALDVVETRLSGG